MSYKTEELEYEFSRFAFQVRLREAQRERLAALRRIKFNQLTLSWSLLLITALVSFYFGALSRQRVDPPSCVIPYVCHALR